MADLRGLEGGERDTKVKDFVNDSKSISLQARAIDMKSRLMRHDNHLMLTR